MHVVTVLLIMFVVHIDLTKENHDKQHPCNYWIDELRLLPSDRECIIRGDWLNDNIIRAAQELLQKAFPNIKGLQPPIIGEVLAFATQKGQFIQILNVMNTHWIMTTSISCQKSEVCVFDSLPSVNVPTRTKQQIANILCSEDKEIILRFPNVQTQRGGSDCGLFAIAFSVSLCNGEDPRTTAYFQGTFRKHLLKCFEEKKLSLFPSRRKVPKGSLDERVVTVPLFCVCRLPEEGKMVACDACGEWFHKDCVTTTPAVWRKKNAIPWLCNICANKH